ncbi:hypothetical protein ASZ90_016559 [hydrocarbon metagenome]|uniref:Uncharacterized protein n=1 Tax=hydrocarbon metagenome TaxID=938273 RepID=A0A0W8ENN4_9ZZZZ
MDRVFCDLQPGTDLVRGITEGYCFSVNRFPLFLALHEEE